MKYNLVQVLNHYHYRISSNQKIHCPIHDETRPSCSVYNDRLNCFGCGWRGDAVDLIMYVEGVGYADAVRKAQEITGQSSEEISGGAARSRLFPDLPWD